MASRALIALLLLVALAGCGTQSSAGTKDVGGSAPGPATDTGGKFVNVEMKNILFVPARITARVGQTIRWTNKDDVTHTVKAVKGANFSSKGLSKGDTYKAKATKTGTISYVCTIHPNQRGTITVVAK
jgi:plastocyanin